MSNPLTFPKQSCYPAVDHFQLRQLVLLEYGPDGSPLELDIYHFRFLYRLAQTPFREDRLPPPPLWMAWVGGNTALLDATNPLHRTPGSCVSLSPLFLPNLGAVARMVWPTPLSPFNPASRA